MQSVLVVVSGRPLCQQQYNNNVLMQRDNLLMHSRGENERENFLSAL